MRSSRPTIRFENTSSMAQAVELALHRRVLGDVGEPDRIRSLGVELAPDQVVVHRRARDLAAATPALLRRGRPDPLLAAQPPHPALAATMASRLELIGDEPVAELGIVGVHVDDGVGEMGVGVVALRAGSSAPLVERLG